MIVLAIGAHPDDIEISCAGTLAKLKRAGHEVHLAHASAGDKGHYQIGPDELSTTRQQEAKNAAAVIDCPSTSLELRDGEIVRSDHEIRLRFIDLVQTVRPDCVITHAPTDYMPDHVAVSQLVFDTTFLATLPGFPTGREVLGTPPALYYMDNLSGLAFEPTLFVDISETFDTKIAMLRRHESQLRWLSEHDDVDILDSVTTMAKARGMQAGCAYAEGLAQHLVWSRPNAIRFPV